MRRRLVILTLAALAAVPALAQFQVVLPPPPAPEPVVQQAPAAPQIQMAIPSETPTFDPASTPDTARAAIKRLQDRIRELRGQMAVTLGDLQVLRTQLDETTRAGGSLVRAVCSSPALSRNTAGAEENCYASGYTCGAVEGTCFRQCTSSSQCAPGFSCDIGAAHCILPPTGEE